VIRLRRGQAEAISRHGEADYPQECCGLLLGRIEMSGFKVVEEAYPISNAREEEAKRNRFLIKPEEFIQGQKYAVSAGMDIVGFYHSHPDHPSSPSEFDKEHAWPAYSYVIVSVNNGAAGDLSSWELEADRSAFEPETITEGE
jgi:proteasome lid subunit RPN8/RPN11